MSVRSAALIIVALHQFFAAADLAEAQRQKGKLGGGAGFAWLSDPDLQLGSTATVGGFIGLRLNDNFSIEGGVYFNRVNRVYNVFGEPLDKEPVVITPDFRFESTRYHADGTVVINLGRRHPFHPFILVGGGIQRRDEKRTNFSIDTEPDTGLEILIPEVGPKETRYLPNAIVGGGADIYFMYNLAARAEVRVWVPKSWNERTFALFFAATYFF